MKTFTQKLIKLGYEKPELRKHIRPVLDRVSSDDMDIIRLKGEFEVQDISPRGWKFIPSSENPTGSWRAAYRGKSLFIVVEEQARNQALVGVGLDGKTIFETFDKMPKAVYELRKFLDDLGFDLDQLRN